MKAESFSAIFKLALFLFVVVGAVLAVVLINESKPIARSQSRPFPTLQQPTLVSLPPPLVFAASTPIPTTRPMPTPTPGSVTITLINDFCEELDYRVDGVRVVSALAAGATTTFESGRGAHSVQACQTGTTVCGEPLQVDWITDATAAIARGACPLTITVINEHCGDEDLYVDGQLVVIALPEQGKATFQVAPGKHLVQACPVGSTNCSETVLMEWLTSTSFSIAREPDCP